MLSGSCDDSSRYAKFDDVARRESHECPKPAEATPLTIRGHYHSVGIRLDYNRLAPLPVPEKNVDMNALGRVLTDPSRMEQVYSDAMQGNGQAIWLAQESPIDIDNPEHSAHVRAVARALGL